MNTPRDDSITDADHTTADARFVRRIGLVVVAIQVLLLLATLAMAHA